MNEEGIYRTRLEKLDKCITELRNLLNEISITSDEVDKDIERLALSRCLDKLIVEYMKEIKKS